MNKMLVFTGIAAIAGAFGLIVWAVMPVQLIGLFDHISIRISLGIIIFLLCFDVGVTIYKIFHVPGTVKPYGSELPGSSSLSGRSCLSLPVLL